MFLVNFFEFVNACFKERLSKGEISILEFMRHDCIIKGKCQIPL